MALHKKFGVLKLNFEKRRLRCLCKHRIAMAAKFYKFRSLWPICPSRWKHCFGKEECLHLTLKISSKDSGCKVELNTRLHEDNAKRATYYTSISDTPSALYHRWCSGTAVDILTFKLQKWPRVSRSTNIKINLSAMYLQAKKAKHLPDPTRHLICRFVYVESIEIKYFNISSSDIRSMSTRSEKIGI